MGFNCDFCGEQRSMIYCRSDAACLCLSCDRNVHSANALSKRHSRTLVCERCSLQPALVRCSEERVSLCQNCDWLGHGTSTSSMNHKRQTINCYTGCPSAAELSSLWSFVLDFPPLGESACEQEMGLMTIAENSTSNWGTPKSNFSQNTSGVAEVKDAPDPKSSVWAGTTSMPDLSASGPAIPPPKISCAAMKNPANFEEEDLYDSLDMDEMELNFENYEELLENGGMDSLFATKDMSAADSNCQGAVAAEVSSGGLVNVQPACSTAASADSMMSSKTEPILCFTSRPAHSSMSFSGGVTGESSAAVDYQDCGASPLLLMGEPPWCPPCPDTSLSFPAGNRNDAVLRYKEKKKTRKFDKKVRYASRKARADVRRRVKGRFVKAGDAYDYDPLSPTRSY